MTSLPARKLRKYVFDHFLDTATAPVVEEIMHEFRVDRDEAVRGLLELQAAHHLLLLPGTQRILMANPFSNLPTPFEVTVGSQRYFANCAWDAIAFHVMLEQEVRVASYCHHCAEPIELRLSQGARVGDGGKDVLVFLGTPVSKWYDNPVETCSNTMVFFASREHLDRWREQHPETVGEALSVDRMIDVVTPISRGRTQLGYQMPSREQLNAYWSALGLRGPFWKF
jgi:hypothetical protein